MSGEEERSAYILETLDGLYSKAADNYKVNNASIIAARNAQSDYNDTLAAIGETIEPATTAVQAGMSTILQSVLAAMQGIDFNALAVKIGEVSKVIADFVTNGIVWIKDNANWLIPVITGLVSSFAAFKIIGTVAPVITNLVTTFGTVFGAIKKVVTAIRTATAIGGALKGVFLAISGPVGWVALAIGALVAAGVALYRNWDTVKAKASELWAWLSATWDGIWAKVSAVWASVTATISSAWDSIWNKTLAVLAAVAGFISGVWNNIKGTASAVWESIKATLAEKWESLKMRASEMANNIKSTISNAFSALKDIMLAPFRAVIDIVSTVASKVSGLIGKITGAKGAASGISVPTYATGGFTSGVSIAGEDPRYPTEAVISFNPAYRTENIGYLAKAARMLGVDFPSFSLSGSSDTSNYYDLGGVTFAPNIVVKGNAKREDIVTAIREAYPEFLDMLDELLSEREATVYA